MSENIENKPRICLNCHHWRAKAWTAKGWGICDNPKNEVKTGVRALLSQYVSDTAAREELGDEIENGIRYPQDFGCIFFETCS